MKVSIIMGSTSDYEVMHGAEQFLADFGIEYEGRGFGVVIAGAGGAAHLAGVAAGLTPLPVIAVPMQTKTLGGLDSLLSMVQMPTGIPVATVAIGGAKNAAILAAEIIALLDPEVAKKIDAYREAQAEKIRNTTLPPKQ